MSPLGGVAVLLAAGAAALLVPVWILPTPGAPDPESVGPRPAITLSGSVTLRALVSTAAGLAGLALFGGATGLLVGPPVAVFAWRVLGGLEPPAQRRRRELLEAGLPHVVDLMAAALAAGLSPSSALQRVARAVPSPISEELAALEARLRLGADPVSVWRDLGAHPQLAPLGRALARAVESGASVAEALLRLAEDLRVTQRADQESRARSVGVQAAVPLGVCLLPAFILVGVVPLVAGSLTLFTGR